MAAAREWKKIPYDVNILWTGLQMSLWFVAARLQGHTVQPKDASGGIFGLQPLLKHSTIFL